MQYAIAYANEMGGLSEREPWIENIGSNISECLNEAKRLKDLGYNNVSPFLYSSYQESYTWDYVKQHKI